MQAMAAQRVEELTADKNRLLGRFGAELEAWARGEASNRRRKTVTLLHGAVSFRIIAPRLEVESLEDAITTARAVAPDTVTSETVERFDKAGFLAVAKAHFEETESFSVKTGGKASAE